MAQSQSKSTTKSSAGNTSRSKAKTTGCGSSAKSGCCCGSEKKSGGKKSGSSSTGEGRHHEGEAVGLTQGEFYQGLYKQAAMGEDSIKAIKPMAEERSLKSFFTAQLKEYAQFRAEVEPKIKAEGCSVDGAPIMTKLMMRGGLAFNTMTDKSSSKLAEIVIQGVNMGVIAVTRLMNEAEGLGLKTELGDRMMQLYDKQLETLKAYL